MPDDGQGSRFTSEAFTGLLEMERVRVSMDGKGYSDNIFVERLWHTVKYKEVYLKAHSSARGARAGFVDYFHFHSSQCSHQALGYPTAAEVLSGDSAQLTDEEVGTRQRVGILSRSDWTLT